MSEQQNRDTEPQALQRISAMIEDEKALREQLTAGEIDGQTEHERLRALERALDQCWDLLRQRRAKADVGQDPNEAHVRSENQVEGYLPNL